MQNPKKNLGGRVQAQFWNEGYRCWWLFSNIRKLPAPIPCRGNVGMWQLSKELQTPSLGAQEDSP